VFINGETMKLRTFVGIAVLGLAMYACGSDDEGSGSSSGSSSSDCQSGFDCLNGACQCTTSGKQGTSCCDPDDCGDDSDNCDDKCEVCD
jgi:hypothetical protein